MLASSQNPYRVRWTIFSSGERMPFLMRADIGLPLEAPTFWIMASSRPVGHQPNTMFNQLRSLMHLYLWADLRGIDIHERLREGVFLSLSEIIDLTGFCGRYLADILQELEQRSSNVVELVKRAKPQRERSVVSAEKRNRLNVIYGFLEFTSADHLAELQKWPDRWLAYNEIRRECLDRIRAYIRGIRAPKRDDVGQREGVDPEVVQRLLTILEPDHAENPFRPEVRFRNYLIVRLLIELGIRRGELLGLYVADLALSGARGSVTVHRRPDDNQDKRREKPATKTAARILPLSARATEMVHEWVVKYRSKLPFAKLHPFLIVSMTDGKPMSLSNVNKIFLAIRKRVPGLPDEIGPHPLRHSWNDAFSEQIDRKGTISPEDEIRWRKRLMGWRSDSTAQHYLRRTIRRRSDEFLAEIQGDLDIRIGSEESDV